MKIYGFKVITHHHSIKTSMLSAYIKNWQKTSILVSFVRMEQPGTEKESSMQCPVLMRRTFSAMILLLKTSFLMTVRVLQTTWL